MLVMESAATSRSFLRFLLGAEKQKCDKIDACLTYCTLCKGQNNYSDDVI